MRLFIWLDLLHLDMTVPASYYPAGRSTQLALPLDMKVRSLHFAHYLAYSSQRESKRSVES